MTLYYVTGIDDYAQRRTVKTEADSPAGARLNARWVLATPGVVRRADRMKTIPHLITRGRPS